MTTTDLDALVYADLRRCAREPREYNAPTAATIADDLLLRGAQVVLPSLRRIKRRKGVVIEVGTTREFGRRAYTYRLLSGPEVLP
jgi:hypothetical protein